jgi:hypothetical protein
LIAVAPTAAGAAETASEPAIRIANITMLTNFVFIEILPLWLSKDLKNVTAQNALLRFNLLDTTTPIKVAKTLKRFVNFGSALSHGSVQARCKLC